MRRRVLSSIRFRATVDAQEDKSDELINTYRLTRPGATPHDILVAVTTDLMRVASIRLAERKTRGGPAPVFMYLFTWESPALDGVLKSCHTLEMPFVFNNVEPPVSMLGDSVERLELAKKMSSAWIAFARKGVPNHDGIPLWPAYETDRRSTMLFNDECRVEEDPQGDERMAWDSIL